MALDVFFEEVIKVNFHHSFRFLWGVEKFGRQTFLVAKLFRLHGKRVTCVLRLLDFMSQDEDA